MIFVNLINLLNHQQGFRFQKHKYIVMTNSILKTVFLFFLANQLFAQTSGSFEFTFTQTPHSTVHGTKHNLAVWFQTESGEFVKTDSRFAGALTNDHLPIWSENAGGPALDCLSPNCNVVNATTGATLADYSTRTVTWDGRNSEGEIVPDGIYKISLEQCWVHGETGKVFRTFLFEKSANAIVLLPEDSDEFTNISLVWNPVASLNEMEGNEVVVFPNPNNTDVLTINFSEASKITVHSLLSKQVYSSKVNKGNKTHSINLLNFENGEYFITVFNNEKTIKCKVIINR